MMLANTIEKVFKQLSLLFLYKLRQLLSIGRQGWQVCEKKIRTEEHVDFVCCVIFCVWIPFLDQWMDVNSVLHGNR